MAPNERGVFPEHSAADLSTGMREFQARTDADIFVVERGYIEMASDARLDNAISHAAHQRAGYQEVDRVVQFRKPLTDRRDER